MLSTQKPVATLNDDEFWTMEDTFTVSPLTSYFDAPEPMEVIIKCPHKRKKVSALMSGSVKINGHANWEAAFGGTILAQPMTLVNDVSNLLQWTTGTSVNQPWLNRKIWKSSEPFVVDIPLTFVSVLGDPKGEVYDPCMALLSFLYPRQRSRLEYEEVYNENGEKLTTTAANMDANRLSMGTAVASGIGKAGSFIKEAMNDVSSQVTQYIGSGTEAIQTSVTNSNNLVGAALNSFKLYAVPGPSLSYYYGTEDVNAGDPVMISIGPVFNLGTVYLEDVQIEFSKTLNPLGYPLAAKVNLKARPLNACFCKPGGDLVIFDEFSDVTKDVANVIDKAQKTGEAISTAAKTYVMNFIGIFQDIGEAKAEVSGGS